MTTEFRPRHDSGPVAIGPPFVRIRLTRSAASPDCALERTGQLTPYLAETVVEDALHCGGGTRLEVTLGSDSGADCVALRKRLAPLRKRGIRVVYRRRRDMARDLARPDRARLSAPAGAAAEG